MPLPSSPTHCLKTGAWKAQGDQPGLSNQAVVRECIGTRGCKPQGASQPPALRPVRQKLSWEEAARRAPETPEQHSKRKAWDCGEKDPATGSNSCITSKEVKEETIWSM